MFHIDYEGQWFHDGDPIQLKTLKKLLSEKSVTADSQGRYWLGSATERHEVSVEDVPYIVIDFRIQQPGTDKQRVLLLTNLDERVVLSPDRTTVLRAEPRGGRLLPYVELKYGLFARLDYDLLNKIKTKACELKPLDDDQMVKIFSEGCDHVLGKMD